MLHIFLLDDSSLLKGFAVGSYIRSFTEFKRAYPQVSVWKILLLYREFYSSTLQEFIVPEFTAILHILSSKEQKHDSCAR